MDIAAVRKSVYDVLKLEKNDLRTKVIGLEYYEDLFSPIITMKIKIVNSGDPILPLSGGERLAVKILKNTSTNIDLDFSMSPSDYFHVMSITDIMTDAGRESFTLNLAQKESIGNELSRVVKKYPKEVPIDVTIRKILTEVLKTTKIYKIDKTSNPYGFIGNMRKPFTVLHWLATKSVPVRSGDASAGFLFYQTKEGFQFRSIDALTQESSKVEYTYSQGNESYTKDNKKINNDFKILNYFTKKDQNIIEKLRLGTYASFRMFFNPLTFNFTSPEEGLFNQSDYDKLGVKAPQIPPGALGLTKTSFDPLSVIQVGGQSVAKGIYTRGGNPEIDLAKTPSRQIVQILDIGTLEKDVSTDDTNADPMKYQSQSLMRYNVLFTRELFIIVPLNSNLSAGNVITCNFPKESKLSGLYIIRELCHHYDSENSYTSMNLTKRDQKPEK
jgi:hypothetical protein